MATSRTGTATWKNLRKRAIYRAKRAGQTDCPICAVKLDYEVSITPASAEVDHVIPHSRGGLDHIDNVTVICRACNLRKGNRTTPPSTAPKVPTKASREW